MQRISKQGRVSRALYQVWYERPRWGVWLRPFSWLYALLSRFNRALYETGIKAVYYPPVMTLVVGNIHVGGSGKSPLIVELYRHFTAKGFKVGILSRGYLADLSQQTSLVSNHTSTDQVGDEAYMIFVQTGAPMVVGARRVEAVKRLLTAHPDLQILLSDDGLQHYALGRDVEIALMPGENKEINPHLLPSGPLREPMSRLAVVDFVLWLANQYQLGRPRSLVTGRLFTPWPEAQTVNAVAGIAHPDRFFDSLRNLGFKVNGYAFDDHHRFSQSDFGFDQEGIPLLMTEKDAVKCGDFAQDHWYKVPLVLSLDSDLKDSILQTLLTKSAMRIGDTHAG